MATAVNGTNGNDVKQGHLVVTATPIIGSQIELDKLESKLNQISDFDVTGTAHLGVVDWPPWKDKAEVWFEYTGGGDETDVQNLVFNKLNTLNIAALNIKNVEFGVSQGENGSSNGGDLLTNPLVIFAGGALTFSLLDQVFD